MQPDLDDFYLVRRSQDGYLDAFEILVQRYTPLAYRVAYRLIGNHQDAQDVTQDSLVAAWEGLARFRGDASFSTWLYRIVTRRSLNKLTRGRVDDSVDLLDSVADDADEPAIDVERTMTANAVTAAIAELPLAQRVVVVLHHLEGLSNAEVAAITRSTVPAVRSHLFRARRTLGATLAKWR